MEGLGPGLGEGPKRRPFRGEAALGHEGWGRWGVGWGGVGVLWVG